MWISKREVQNGLIEENLILVNTLSPAVFRGSEVKYGRAGHIPRILIFIISYLQQESSGEGFYLKASANI